MDGMESSQAQLQQHHDLAMENATSSFISWAQPSQRSSLQELSPTNCRTSRAARSKERPQSSKGTSSHNINQNYWEVAHEAVPEHQRIHLTQQNAQQEHQEQYREERMEHQHRREHWREHQQAHGWTTPSRIPYWRRKDEAQHQEMSNHNNIDKMEVGKNIIIKEQDGFNIKNGMVGNIDNNNNYTIKIGMTILHGINPTLPTTSQKSISENVGRTTRWRTSSQDLLNIFHLQATWHIAIGSSSLIKMSAIILPQDPRVHHDLLADILTHTITHILNLGLPRVELRSHLASALHAVPGSDRSSQASPWKPSCTPRSH